MIYHLILKEEAVNDIEEAFMYYENEISELGFRFIRELDEYFEQLKEHPLHYSFFLNQQEFRSLSLKHFPFSIIYEVTNKDVTVFALYNHRRNPDTILKRF